MLIILEEQEVRQEVLEADLVKVAVVVAAVALLVGLVVAAVTIKAAKVVLAVVEALAGLIQIM
jgi:hypothetical protein